MSTPERSGTSEQYDDARSSVPGPAHESKTEAMVTEGPAGDAEWRRLDKRMLLIHPVRELTKYIPVLIGAVIVGSQSDNPAWSPVVAGIIVVIALARWFTTAYRIGPDTVQLRRGLLQRRTLTVPRSRIRSVDVQADVMHRLLGLVRLVIGTGRHADREERFHLDGVDARQVPELRALLLERSRAERADEDADTEVASAPDTTPPDGRRASLARALRRGSGDTPAEGTEIGHWRPRWVRYAPLSLTGLAIVGPVVGLAAKVGVADVLVRSDAVRGLSRHSVAFIVLAVVAAVAVLLVIAAVAACIHYLTTYFGLRVVDDGTALHIRSGLLTTRQTTLDLSRLRGATVQEPLLLRLAGGAELEAIMTGTGARQKLLPQAPRAAVDRTLAQLLTSPSRRSGAANSAPAQPLWDDIETAAAPASIPLERHGPRAHRRRFTRAFIPVWAALAALLVISLAGPHVPIWVWALFGLLVLASAALAQERYRGLGHAVIPSDGARPVWLITRRGALERDRDCLEAPGVIGWTVRRTFFQRRAGLATLVAASAAGKKKYSIVDVPVERAWTLIEEVTPGYLGTPPQLQCGRYRI
ncbi:pleckstrin PH domain-containing protein [Nocardia nova SH22a]|uniref:Pleckstrin PH domain-containing protein n=1 Tax=Nocardia nova SH22a TaxID=1415166 RepID=W5TPN8_9NOCA|nr:PH domain-containing protein [Nocardia nova]AHH21227.1 pleckstrin PH domain-containing protein [Nocardia nova SH22a]